MALGQIHSIKAILVPKHKTPRRRRLQSHLRQSVLSASLTPPKMKYFLLQTLCRVAGRCGVGFLLGDSVEEISLLSKLVEEKY